MFLTMDLMECGYGHIGQVISGVEDGIQDDSMFHMVQVVVKYYIDTWCFYSFKF